MKYTIALILALTNMSLQAQTNNIYTTAVFTTIKTSQCGAKCAGADYYQGGSFHGFYTWNTNSTTHSIIVSSNYCIYWANAGGPHGQAYGTVSPTYEASVPYYQFICYPTNSANLNTNFSMQTIGFNP